MLTLAHSVVTLSAWENFYVIVGSSAGALTGLTFIVITLAADASGMAMTPAARMAGLRAFITPIVVHFGAVLWVAALMSVPGQTRLSLAVCLAVTGLAGAVYCTNVARWFIESRTNYRPFLSDWIWTLILPPCAYLALLTAAVWVRAHLALALYAMAASSLLLLLLGLHNAWDVVAWITTERHAHGARQRAAQSKQD